MAFGKKRLSVIETRALSGNPVTRLMHETEKRVLLEKGHMPTEEDHLVAQIEVEMGGEDPASLLITELTTELELGDIMNKAQAAPLAWAGPGAPPRRGVPE